MERTSASKPWLMVISGMAGLALQATDLRVSLASSRLFSPLALGLLIPRQTPSPLAASQMTFDLLV